jgi:hypothetical protein
VLTKEQINKFLYLPPPGVLIVNAVFFAVVFGFAIIGYFSETIDKALAPLVRTDKSLLKTSLILLGGLVGVSALIYGRTRKFFLCSCDCLRAAIGTTLVMTLLYALIWSLIQIAQGKQQLVVFHPRLWSAQYTLNNLKYAGVLLLFSSGLSILSSLAISVWSGYDFTTLLNHWKKWIVPVQKLSQKMSLSPEEHELLVNSTQGMLDAISTAGYVQPVAEQSTKSVKGALLRFQSWYADQTEHSYADCKKLDESIEKDAKRILYLC